MLRALREIRSRQNIARRQPISFAACKCDASHGRIAGTAGSLLRALANATVAGDRASRSTPPADQCHAFNCADMEVYVDLAGLIDVEAESQHGWRSNASGWPASIAGKEKKLANADFVEPCAGRSGAARTGEPGPIAEQLTTVSENLAGLDKAGS